MWPVLDLEVKVMRVISLKLSQFEGLNFLTLHPQTLNYDLTKNYLDLIVTYISIMILMSKVDDRKVVLALYNCAHEFLHGKR